jgi:hypothetical protein
MTQSFLIFLAACLSTVSAAPVVSEILPDQQATKLYTLLGSLYGAPTLVGPHPNLPSPTNHEIVVEFAPHENDNEPTDIWLDYTDVDTPQPIRGSAGGTIATNQNIELTKQNPDTFAPPLTDKGDVAQLKWPMALSHSKLVLSSVHCLFFRFASTGCAVRKQSSTTLTLGTLYFWTINVSPMTFRLFVLHP